MNPLSLIFGGVVGAVKTLGSQWMLGKQKKHEAKMAQIQQVIQGKQDYNSLAQQGMAASFKDELVTIWLLTVMSLNFVPSMQPYMENGWKFVASSVPPWFAWAFTGMIVAVYGLKGYKGWKNGG